LPVGLRQSFRSLKMTFRLSHSNADEDSYGIGLSSGN
jgi:hypothetical protein